MGRTYPGKVLLFGEYGVIVGGPALAIPLKSLYATWNTDPNHAEWPFDISSFEKHLIKVADRLEVQFDSGRFESDVDENLTLTSNIPIGHGLGSSGAVSAAIYDRYFSKNNNTLEEIKAILAAIEGFFHGSSSGLDPLVSYNNNGIVVDGPEAMRSVIVHPDVLQHIYLLDTNKERRTKPLVEKFKSWIESDSYKQAIYNIFIPAIGTAISASIEGRNIDLKKAFTTISQFQWDYFRDMIIPDLHDIWQEGLLDQTYTLKLCGAGGGGSYLVYIDNEKIREKLESTYNWPIHPLV